MDGADGDAAYARAAAKEMLVSYRAGSALEIQLATECIVFAYSAMETLRHAKPTPRCPTQQRLRLRNRAASLNRASQRNRHSLDALRNFRSAPPNRPNPDHKIRSG
jgi:hypothetical protein